MFIFLFKKKKKKKKKNTHKKFIKVGHTSVAH